MGLTLAVLVGLLALMPGAAFVFGLTRLHSPTSPTTTLDQHFSVGLLVALLSALVVHGLAIALLRWCPVPQPELSYALALLGGDLELAAAKDAVASVSEYPVRIATYFVLSTMLAFAAGRALNGALPVRRTASWYELLKPDGWDFVVITADIELNGSCYLFSGVVSEFSISKCGNLERVVLVYAGKKFLSEAGKDSPPTVSGDGGAKDLGHGWVEIPGEFMVLKMAHALTINCDYFTLDGSDSVPPAAAIEDASIVAAS